MNHSTPLARMIYSFSLLLGFFCAAISHAQTNSWLPASGTNAWTDATNWSFQTVPNASGATVLFGAAQSVSLSQTVTVGSIFTTHTSGNVVIGNTDDLADILVMDAGTNSPVINVGSGGILYMYADLEGTNGYTKSGSGTLHLRYNPNDQFIDGPLVMAGGTLQIRYDGHFGGVNSGFTNAIVFSGNSTIQHYSSPDALVIPATRSIVINSGVTGTFQNATNTGLVINCSISGAGNLQFTATNGSYTLNAANTYTGNTTVNNGAKLILGPGANISTAGSLTLMGANAGSVDFGGNSQTVASYSGSFTNGTAVFTNGTLSITGNVAMGIGALTNGAGTDMSGLNGFSYVSPTKDFQITANATSGGNPVTNSVFLAKSGTNLISGANVRFGGGAQLNVSQNSLLKLGENNIINATNEFVVGYYNGSGSASFASGLTNPTLKVRGSNDTTPVPSMRVGSANGGNSASIGSLDLAGGSLDIMALDFDLGAQFASANSASTGTLTMTAGTLVASNLSLGRRLTNPTSGAPTLTGTLNQLGGAVKATNVFIGYHDNTNAAVTSNRYISTYNLDGGTLQARYVGSGGGTNFATNSSRRVNWTGGEIGTVGSSTNLTIAGTNGTGGLLEILTTGNKTKAFSTNSLNAGSVIDFSSTTWLIANGGDLLIDLGSSGILNHAGSVSIGSANYPNTTTYATNSADASITVASGTANFAAGTRIFGIGDRTSGGTASFKITGGVANLNLSGNRMLVGNKGQGSVLVSGGVLNITNNNDIYVGGDFAYAATNASGVFTISGGEVNITGIGRIFLAQNSTNGSGVLNSSDVLGTLNLNGGILATSRRITPGTNGTFTATVNLNGGTLKALTNQSDWITVPNLNVLSASTIDTGGFDVGITQNLVGAGKLIKAGAGTLTLSGANSYAGDTDVNAGALSLLGAVASPSINVAGGAALVLSTAPIGPITNNIDFSSGAKVRVNGTPSGSVNLLTTSGTISGSPTLETDIPGYTLVTSGNAITLQENVNTTPPTITSTNAFSGTVGVAFSNNIEATGSTPITFSGTGLPGGLSVASGGAITGTPTAAGTFNATLTATNAAGTDNQSVTFTIAKGSQTTVSGSLGSATIPFGETTTVTASGGSGTGAYEFRQNGGTGGVSFSGTGTSRTISTTSAGTAVIEVRRVADANYNDSDWASAGTLTVNPAGASFASWSSGGATNSELVGKYAIGGASNSSAAAEKPMATVDSNTLSLSAIVRTNDAKLDVVGEAGGSLTSWNTSGVTMTVSTNTNNVPVGHQRQVFSVDRTNAPTKQFLRLKATLQP